VPHASNKTVDAYIAGVLSGAVPVNELARLAIERHVADVERWPAQSRDEALDRGDPFYFDEEAAQLVLDFYPLCQHVAGELAGRPFEPLPYQATVDWISFGWMRAADGKRRFNERWIEEPRGNGKTFWLACNGVYMMSVDGEFGAKVYAFATEKGQVSAPDGVWGTARAVIDNSSALSGEFIVQDSFNNHRILIPGSECEFRPLKSDSRKADQLNPHCILGDEIHEWRHRDLYAKLKTAMGKRSQAMLSMFTTAGDDRPNTLYEELHGHAIRVLRGWRDESFIDDSFFAIVFAVDSKADGCEHDDDEFDEANWYRANPALGFPGTAVNLGHLRSMAHRAAVEPEVKRDLLRFHLGRRASGKTKAISDDAWKNCGCPQVLAVAEQHAGRGGIEKALGSETARILRALAAADWGPFDGRPSYWALDLSSARDLTALSGYFPPWEDWPFETYRFFAWLPQDNLVEACKRDLAPYDRWVREGWLELTPGNEIDNKLIFDRVLEVNERYLVVQWAYDPWHAVSLKNDVYAATGIEMVKFVQDLPSFGEPTRIFLDSIAGQKLRHDGNPLARWCASNVVTKEDHHGNKRPHKGMSDYRIDLIVAAIMARGRAIVTPVPTGPPPPTWDGRVESWG